MPQPYNRKLTASAAVDTQPALTPDCCTQLPLPETFRLSDIVNTSTTHLQTSNPKDLQTLKLDEGSTNTFFGLYTCDISLDSFYFTLITSIKDKHSLYFIVMHMLV